MTKNITIGVLAVYLIAFVTVFAYSQNSYEYHSIEISVQDSYGRSMFNDSNAINLLNHEGQQGWELCGATWNNFILKRRLQ